MRAFRTKSLLLTSFTICVMVACGTGDSGGEDADVPPDTVVHSDPIPVPPPEPTQQYVNLQEFLDAPLDFTAYKKANRRMLNCGERLSNLYRPDTVGFNYGYCLFNASFPEGKSVPGYDQGDKMLEFTVYMYGDKIGYYNNSNETLLAIRARASDPRLGQANLVGLDSTEVMARFGPPMQRRGSAAAWWIEEKLLLIRYGQGEVDRFRFQRMFYSLGANDSLPEDQWAWPGWD